MQIKTKSIPKLEILTHIYDTKTFDQNKAKKNAISHGLSTENGYQ